MTETLEPMNEIQDQEWRKSVDKLLEAHSTEREKSAFSLPQLLGQPQPYEPIPGLHFKRPKLGHKLDIFSRYKTLQDKSIEEEWDAERSTLAMIELVLPYTYLPGAEGSLVPATRDQLLYEVFDDNDQVGEFFDALMSRTAKTDDPNAPTLTPSETTSA